MCLSSGFLRAPCMIFAKGIEIVFQFKWTAHVETVDWIPLRIVFCNYPSYLYLSRDKYIVIDVQQQLCSLHLMNNACHAYIFWVLESNGSRWGHNLSSAKLFLFTIFFLQLVEKQKNVWASLIVFIEQPFRTILFSKTK